jgi:Golgi phosphoprotein 3
VLSLAEELLLLAIDDESNRVPMAQSSKLDYVLAGAVLMDLLLTDRLRFADGKLAVADASPTGDAVLDDALTKLERSAKPRSPQHWVNRLAGDHLRDRVIDELVQRQIVRREEHHILGIFPANRFPTEDPTPEQAVRARLRAVLLEGREPEPRDAALVALLKAGDLLGAVLSKEERHRAGERVKELTRPAAVGKATTQTIAAVEAAADAVMAAVIAAVVAASTAAR